MPDRNADRLVRGEDILEKYEDFRLVGRDNELKKLSGMLMRKNANNVLLVGPGGVGCSALCMGLQASKEDPHTPFDIVNKRFFWLDTDGLFSSGDNGNINEAFEKLRRTLLRTTDSVLIIEDFRDFIDAARNAGATHLINAIMRDTSDSRYQVILESRDEDLEVVLKAHSNMREYFTLMDVQEPVHDVLFDIIRDASKSMEEHHKIKISDEAIHAALDLTSKYRVSDMSLSRAQPERTLNLIDRALTSYRQSAHANPPHLDALKNQIDSIELALGGNAANGLKDKSESELETMKIETQNLLDSEQQAWDEKSEELHKFYKAQREGEDLLRGLEEELDKERQKQKDKENQETEVEEDQPSAKKGFTGFGARLGNSGFGSKEENRINDEIRAATKAIEDNKGKFEALTAEINANLSLEPSQVMTTFSDISGIPADKLNQDEREKLLQLEDNLKSRVFGQDEAVEKLVGAVLMANAGLKEPDKPQGSFMFCGPSGVGKTEISKALAAALKDDEKAMLRFDMSEYMEKHGVAKLIGAPPGYEGYEAGGILTNSVRRNPHSIILFDEIEKAHPDVFNVFLQVLDDGRLTDNRGLTVSFADTLIIMTTNIGQPHFLDKSMDYTQAMEETMLELDDKFRPEFLNRFNGRENIVGFNQLPLTIIEKIATRELQKVNARIASGGNATQIIMDEQTIAAICKDKYDPARGARGIPGFFTSRIYPTVARGIIGNPESASAMQVEYNSKSGEVSVHPAEQDVSAKHDMKPKGLKNE